MQKRFCLQLLTLFFSSLIISCDQQGHGERTVHPTATDSTSSSHEKQADPTTESGYSKVNGINMYYEILGSGSPLVLIHGGGSTIETSFGRILPLLAKKRKVIAMELQAHGHTQDRDAPLSFKQDAADVAMLLENLHIDKADVMGFSNGAQTAMQLAISYPSLVNKLIMGSGFYKKSGVPAGFWTAMNHAKFSDMPQALKDGFLKVKPDSAALLNMFHKSAHRMQTFTSWRDAAVGSITAPTLIIIGDGDVTRPEHAVEMFRLIPHSHLAIIPGGHGQYLGEITTLENGKWKQEYVAGLFEDFLESKQ